MDGRPVQLRIAGQSYRVVSSASEEDLHRLAETVSAKVHELTPPGKVATSQAVLLAAMALAHDLEEERSRRVAVERRAREMLRRVIGRIDEALGASAVPTSSPSVEASAAEH
jgi:cell division protein ZapA